MSAETKLRQLPRNRFHVHTFFAGSRYSLWLENETLISVRTESYSETAKRFELRDIQCLVVTETKLRFLRYTFPLVIALLGGLLALTVNIQGFARPAMWILIVSCTLAALWAFLFWLLSPTCTVDLHTAVQRERLQACWRLRTAEKLLSALLPAIERAQAQD